MAARVDKPLCTQYPILYELSLNKNSSVWNVARANWVIQFRIRLPPTIRGLWYDLVNKLDQVTLNEEKDQAVWNWTSKKFMVMYCLQSHNKK
jgi:hypothetical protein